MARVLRSTVKTHHIQFARSYRAAYASAAAAPLAPPASEEQIAALVSAFQDSKRLVVLTGAGCSTESGVPDYRSPQGAYSTGFKPMTHQQFLASPANQARYWARSFYGWQRFSATQPNSAHVALAELEHRGWVSGIVTQNVDRLHSRAGSRQVLELHGTSHQRFVAPGICAIMLQGGVSGLRRPHPRQEVQDALAALNPAAAVHAAALAAGPPDAAAERLQALRVGTARDDLKVAASAGVRTGGPPPLSSPSGPTGPRQPPGGSVQVLQQRPDGDVELVDAGSGFHVAPCGNCGGLLKPDVVFFGDNIPQERKDRAAALAASADVLLVVGSSVMVYSAYRLVEVAKAAGARLLIVNVGPTRADRLANIKVEARAGEVLTRLARHPALQVPKLF